MRFQTSVLMLLAVMLVSCSTQTPTPETANVSVPIESVPQAGSVPVEGVVVSGSSTPEAQQAPGAATAPPTSSAGQISTPSAMTTTAPLPLQGSTTSVPAGASVPPAVVEVAKDKPVEVVPGETVAPKLPREFEVGALLKIYKQTSNNNNGVEPSPDQVLRIKGLTLNEIDYGYYQRAQGYFKVDREGDYNIQAPKAYRDVQLSIDGVPVADTNHLTQGYHLTVGWHLIDVRAERRLSGNFPPLEYVPQIAEPGAVYRAITPVYRPKKGDFNL
jgi:hypothetical protein